MRDSGAILSKQPLVTIGLPFYNSERTLATAVQSVFAQTFQNWELILMDDGSSDRSLEVVRNIADPRVKIHSDGHNRGLPFRLNQIATLASGEFLARMDADDLMYPTRIESQLNYLRRHNPSAIVTSGATLISPGGFPIAQDFSRPSSNPFQRMISPRIIHPTVFGRTAWFRANAYSTSCPRAEDYELWCRMVSNQIVSMPEPLLFYRVAFNLKNYLTSCRSQCRLALERSSGIAALPAKAILLSYFVARTGLWSVAALLRMTGTLQSAKLICLRRFKHLKPHQIAEALQIMDIVYATKVPGLEERQRRARPPLTLLGSLAN